MADMESRGGHGGASSGGFGSGFSVQRRPNAFGGTHHAPGGATGGALQPRSNKQQRLNSRVHAGALQVLPGGI